jgi:hypothetical protein
MVVTVGCPRAARASSAGPDRSATTGFGILGVLRSAGRAAAGQGRARRIARCRGRRTRRSSARSLAGTPSGRCRYCCCSAAPIRPRGERRPVCRSSTGSPCSRASVHVGQHPLARQHSRGRDPLRSAATTGRSVRGRAIRASMRRSEPVTPITLERVRPTPAVPDRRCGR